MQTSVTMRKPPASYDEIRRATVPRVDMFRDVRAPHEHTGPERELAERVRIALASDACLDAHRIEVSAHGSRIRLSGIAPGPGSAAYAIDIAGGVDGVTAVIDDLRIDPSGR